MTVSFDVGIFHHEILLLIIPRFELYERGVGTSKSDKEFSIKLSLSEGAHSSNVLDSAIDARHALNVQGRKYARETLEPMSKR